jgi:hypothetical protein
VQRAHLARKILRRLAREAMRREQLGISGSEQLQQSHAHLRRRHAHSSWRRAPRGLSLLLQPRAACRIRCRLQ